MVKKPVRSTKIRSVVDAPATSLMSTQDTRRKGDSTGTARKRDKVINFWVTEEYRTKVKAYAEEHNMTMTQLIVDALNARMRRR